MEREWSKARGLSNGRWPEVATTTILGMGWAYPGLAGPILGWAYPGLGLSRAGLMQGWAYPRLGLIQSKTSLTLDSSSFWLLLIKLILLIPALWSQVSWDPLLADGRQDIPWSQL